MHVCSMLLGLHRTSVLRHNEVGQEVLLNLLLRNYLHYNLYEQVCNEHALAWKPVSKCWTLLC